MTNSKKLLIGLVAATMLVATPVVAQEVNQKPGAKGSYYPNSRHLTRGYGVRATPRSGYYYGNRYHSARRVGTVASAPWDGSYYGYNGSLGLVERQW